MSRIGRLPITVPAGVDVSVDGVRVSVKGPKGTLSRDIAPRLTVVREDGVLRVERPDDAKESRELHGLTRTLINNMVVGVTTGYRKGLEITGVGYRAQLVG
ncbi:MAG: 50S ribosomal protein L6, partial [Chloroflexota bacterium]